MSIRAWWFGGDELPHGDGRAVTEGCTLTVEGPPVLCQHGLHGSRRVYDALKYASGSVLWRVEIGGDVVEGNDKLCGTERKHIKRLDVTGVLGAFARRCALDVIDKWDAPAVVREYLKTGDESLRAAASDAAWAAARYAARDAARYAAWDAAWAAASDAARYAARDAARYAAWDNYAGWLEEMIVEAMEESE